MYIQSPPVQRHRTSFYKYRVQIFRMYKNKRFWIIFIEKLKLYIYMLFLYIYRKTKTTIIPNSPEIRLYGEGNVDTNFYRTFE